MIKNLLTTLKSKAPQLKPDGPESVTPDLRRILTLREVEIVDDHIDDDAPIYGDTEEMTVRAERAVEELSGQFEVWMKADLERMANAWTKARTDEPLPENYRALFMTAHNIRGVAPAYGYPAIGRLCGSLCRLLNDTPPGKNSALINIHVEACNAAYNPVNQTDGANAVADAVCEALEARVETKLKLVSGQN